MLNPFPALRYCAGLAVDAVEAVLWLWPSDRAADVLWGETQADRLVEKEAQEEVAEPKFVDPTDCVFCGCAFNCDGQCEPPPKTPAGGEAPNPPADAPRCTSPDPSAGQPTSIAEACARIHELEAENTNLRWKADATRVDWRSVKDQLVDLTQERSKLRVALCNMESQRDIARMGTSLADNELYWVEYIVRSFANGQLSLPFLFCTNPDFFIAIADKLKSQYDAMKEVP